MRYLIFSFSFLFFSCSSSVQESDLTLLNQYWEIDFVTKNGTKIKDYKVNPYIDFYLMSGKKGVRKKLMPNFTGTYQANMTADSVFILKQDGRYVLKFQNEFNTWIQLLNSITASELVLESQEGAQFYYKKHSKFLDYE